MRGSQGVLVAWVWKKPLAEINMEAPASFREALRFSEQDWPICGAARMCLHSACK